MRPPSGIITFLTDFGVQDPYVGVMKGMAKRQHPRADCIDICHEVPPQDLEVASFFAASIIDRFPAGTVHVAVVDPGVGGERRGLAAFAHDCYWIAPDNGLLGEVLSRDADPVLRECGTPEFLGLPRPSDTFHGRDLFAPLAGRLSSGRFGFPSVGRRVDDYCRLEAEPETARVLWVDHFGNLITTVDGASIGSAASVRIGEREVPLARTYSDAPSDGSLLALVGSYGLLEVAARNARADQILGVGRGTRVEVVHNASA